MVTLRQPFFSQDAALRLNFCLQVYEVFSFDRMISRQKMKCTTSLKPMTPCVCACVHVCVRVRV